MKPNLVAVSVAIVASSTTDAFNAPICFVSSCGRSQQVWRKASAHMAKKRAKGFGKSPPSSPAPVSDNESPSVPATRSIESTEQNAGQKALERMRRAEAEKRNAELRKVAELREMDEYVRDEGPPVIPEKVAMRMGSRMLPFVGIPLFGGMGLFVGFWYFATYKNVEFQPALVAASTIALLVVGLLGITYSVMSASWDPDREGSGLGADEFSTNVNNLREGLARSRENNLLRERMAGLPEEEIQAAIRDLDRRDARKKREEEAKKGLAEKINKDLE